MSFDTVQHVAPEYWASYLINGDASGLDDAEQSAADAWMRSIGLGDPVDVESVGFDVIHTAHLGGRFAGDVARYTFLEARPC